jgi:hypothetical protein
MMTLTYGPQEFAGQLSSYAAEGAEYKSYMEGVLGEGQKIIIAAYCAYDLAISERDAVKLPFHGPTSTSCAAVRFLRSVCTADRDAKFEAMNQL